jgi:hypothetical protein
MQASVCGSCDSTVMTPLHDAAAVGHGTDSNMRMLRAPRSKQRSQVKQRMYDGDYCLLLPCHGDMMWSWRRQQTMTQLPRPMAHGNKHCKRRKQRPCPPSCAVFVPRGLLAACGQDPRACATWRAPWARPPCRCAPSGACMHKAAPAFAVRRLSR